MNELNLPSGWELRSLSSLATVVSGGTPSRDIEEYWNLKEISWVTPTDITKGRTRFLSVSKESISVKGLNSSSASLVPSGTILMTSRATLGEAKISSIECCTNQGFKSLVPNKDVPSAYLYYLMQFYKRDYSKLGIGSTFLEVNKQDTESFLVPVAPQAQREKIATILSNVDDQIDITQALIDKYTLIKQGMMADLFSRGIDISTGQMRPSFEEVPELYHKMDLGWLPKGWEVVELAKVSIKITDGDHHTPERTSEGTLLLSARNVHDGYLDLSNVDYVPRAEYQRMIKRCFPEAGDILISCSGSIGRVCEVPEKIEFSLVRSVALVKLNRDVVHPNYIAWYLRTDLMQKAMKNSALQAAQPNLFQGPIEKLKVITCEPVEQLAIAERLNAIENEIYANKKQLNKLKLIKLGLMQDLLTGKVSVQ